jgi:hypothetical protein
MIRLCYAQRGMADFLTVRLQSILSSMKTIIAPVPQFSRFNPGGILVLYLPALCCEFIAAWAQIWCVTIPTRLIFLLLARLLWIFARRTYTC